jgi:hypothetical protein
MLQAPRRLVPPALMALMVLGHVGPLAACDVPVYEYALLHWPRQDYSVYYVHAGAEAPADAEANGLLRRVAEGQEGHANLRFCALNATLAPASLTPEARYVLTATRALDRPRHLVVSPKGRAIFSGRLTAQDVCDLLASPATDTLADMLTRGARGVLIVMTDGDDAGSQAALQVAQSVVNAAADGQPGVGLLPVARQDPRESWLVRELLAVEPGLGDMRGPMVFGAYGRCHVTEAYLGKGINAANLTDLVRFMQGPCTCDIRAANLGVDLISNWEWEAHVPGAATLAQPLAPPGYMTLGE